MIEGIQIPTTNIVLGNVDATTSAEKSLKVAGTKLEGSSTTFVSHSFCDKTTWWGESVRVTQEILTANSDSTIYTSPSSKVNWINLVSGKVPYEDRISASYKTIVYIDDSEVTSGFTVDYANGAVTFAETKEGHTVKATYSYAMGSKWTIEPAAGKILKLIGTEVKVASNTTISSPAQSIVFQLYVGGYPYGSPTVYKNLGDFVKCANAGIERIAKFGCFQNDIVVLPFDYETSKDLRSSLAMKIKIWVANDEPMTGDWGVVVARGISISE